jgi:hypothetical protein
MSFLEYTGNYKKTKGLYKFIMEGSNKQYFIELYSFSAVADPTIENTFKQIFLYNESITKALLNLFLFQAKIQFKKENFFLMNILELDPIAEDQ